MLKYMLTNECNRHCSYCITRNIHCEETTSLSRVQKVLWKLRLQGNEEIMITGGEPTLSKLYSLKLLTAGLIFTRVYITTQNKKMLKERDEMHFIDAITFSLHGEEPIKVEVDIPVFAAILDEQYYKGLPMKLKKLGYAGLTINEEQRGKKTFNELLSNIKDFSIRINRLGKCMDETIILPDLKIIHDYTPYL